MIIRKGESYTAVRKRSGSSDKGDWELLSVTDTNGRNTIAVFVTNIPSGVNETERFRVDEIESVSMKRRKSDSGAWYTEVSVSASVTPVKGLDEYLKENPGTATDEEPEPPDEGGELPF